MSVKSCIAAAALSMLPMLSQANVVYEWKTITDGVPPGISVRLEFDDATAKEGGFEFDLASLDDPFQWSQPLGLISLSFDVPGTGGFNFTREDGFGGGMGTYAGELKINVSLDSYLTGSIQASNFDTKFWMTSDGSYQFGLNSYVSDGLFPACLRETSYECTSTGFIQLVEVPEPGSLALFGAGLLAASRIRRRKTL